MEILTWFNLRKPDFALLKIICLTDKNHRKSEKLYLKIYPWLNFSVNAIPDNPYYRVSNGGRNRATSGEQILFIEVFRAFKL